MLNGTSVRRLCRTEDVPGDRPLLVNTEGLPPLAVYRSGAEYFVTDALCTHGKALLTEGYLEGDIVECPFHGGRFCIRTGAPKGFPCVVPLRTYDVVNDDGHVAIAMP